VLGVGEEQELLVAVVELGEPSRDSDHRLLHSAEPAPGESCVDANPQRLPWRRWGVGSQLNLIRSSVINPRMPSVGLIFFPSSRLRATYEIGTS
jgi:hypothetical protein